MLDKNVIMGVIADLLLYWWEWQAISAHSRATFHQPRGASGCPVQGRSRLLPLHMVPATISFRPCTRFRS